MVTYTFTNGTVADADEVNTNFTDIQNSSLTIAGLNHIRQLIDRVGVYSAGNIDGWGEAYVSAGGRNGSVDTGATDATFDTDKYKADGTGDDLIYQSIPTGTFSSTVSSVIGVPFLEDWETGADIQFKLQAKIYDGTTINEDYSTGDTNSTGTTSETVRITPNEKCKVNTITLVTNGSADPLTINLNGETENITSDVVTFSSPPELQAGVGYTVTITSTSRVAVVDNMTIPTIGTKINLTQGNSADSSFIQEMNVEILVTDQDTGWLDASNSPEVQAFTAFTSEPTTLIVKLVPKTTSPTAGYPSVKGFWIK